MGQSKAAVPVVTRKPCTLYRKLTEIMEVVQTQLVLAGFTAATKLTLPLALKFSPLTKGRGLCCLSCAFCRHLGASFFLGCLQVYPERGHAGITLPDPMR